MNNFEDCEREPLFFTDVYEAIWKELALFTDIHHNRALISSNLTRAKKSIERKSNHLSFCVRQAKDYFDAAREVTIISQPTLIYYGTMSLAVALLILRDSTLDLDNIKNSHGLKAIYSSTSAETLNKQTFLDLSVKIENTGTFISFCQIDISDRFTIAWQEPGLVAGKRTFQRRVNLGTSLVGQTLSLRQLLPLISEIVKELNVSLSVRSNMFQGGPYRYIGEQPKIHLSFSKLNDVDASTIEDNFSSKMSNYRLCSETKSALIYELNDSSAPLPNVKPNIVDVNYMTDQNPLSVADLHIYYLTFFILGSLARYKPHLWGFWLFDPKDNIKLLADTVCQSALIKIPLLFLNEMKGKYFSLK